MSNWNNYFLLILKILHHEKKMDLNADAFTDNAFYY